MKNMTQSKPKKNTKIETTAMRYYSPTELAAKWGLNVETVRREIKRGRLGALVIGRRKRISEEAAAAYEARNTKG